MKKILMLFFIIFMVGVGYAHEENSKPSIKVIGYAYVEAQPDTAYFNMTVSVEKSSVEEVERLGSRLKQNIKKSIINDLGKSSILVDSSNINKRYQYPEKTYFHVYSYKIVVKIDDFDKLAALRKKLINNRTFAPANESWFSDSGLKVSHYVEYRLDKKRGYYDNIAINRAYKDAISKLDTIAKAGNLKYSLYKIETLGRPSITNEASHSMNYRGVVAMSEKVEEPEATIPTLKRINAEVKIEALIE